MPTVPLGSIRAPPRGSWVKHKKIFFSETKRPRAFIFCLKQCIVVLFINPANRAPGVHTGPAPGGSWVKHKKNLLLRNHKAQSFHILFVATYNGLLYKSCQPCPCGPYGPRPGSVMGKTLKTIFFFETTRPKAFIFCV